MGTQLSSGSSGEAGEMGSIDLRAIRERANLKQGELADLLSISRSYLSRLEAGERRPDLDVAERIVKACGGRLILIFDSLIEDIADASLEDRVVLSRLARALPAMHPHQRRDLEALMALWERQVTERQE